MSYANEINNNISDKIKLSLPGPAITVDIKWCKLVVTQTSIKHATITYGQKGYYVAIERKEGERIKKATRHKGKIRHIFYTLI